MGKEVGRRRDDVSVMAGMASTVGGKLSANSEKAQIGTDDTDTQIDTDYSQIFRGMARGS